jgi:hypothetical protein
MDEDREFEHSPLSGPFSRDGDTVEVEIYRRAGSQEPWRMEVVSLTGGCTKWPVRFSTEKAAFGAFEALVAEHGLAIFTGIGPKQQH